MTKVFWALDAKLAYKRHFPAINWLQSYSLYAENLSGFYTKEVAADFPKNRDRAQVILQEESKLEEIVRLVGTDALSPKEQLTLEVARMIREDFLFQNAFDRADAFTSLKKQHRILKTILSFMDAALPVVAQEDFDMQKIREIPVKERITQAHLIAEDALEEFDLLDAEIVRQISALRP